jgi:hypothetical protein
MEDGRREDMELSDSHLYLRLGSAKSLREAMGPEPLFISQDLLSDEIVGSIHEKAFRVDLALQPNPKARGITST